MPSNSYNWNYETDRESSGWLKSVLLKLQCAQKSAENLGEMQSLVQQVRGLARDSAALTAAHRGPAVPVSHPHVEQQGFKWCDVHKVSRVVPFAPWQKAWRAHPSSSLLQFYRW